MTRSPIELSWTAKKEIAPVLGEHGNQGEGEAKAKRRKACKDCFGKIQLSWQAEKDLKRAEAPGFQCCRKPHFIIQMTK